MDAPPAVRRCVLRDFSNAEWVTARRLLAAMLLAAFVASSLLLLTRRLGGHLSQPLPTSIFLSIAILGLLWSVSVRRMFAAWCPNADRLTSALLTVCLLATGVSLTFPSMAWGATAAFWIVILSPLAWTASTAMRGRRARMPIAQDDFVETVEEVESVPDEDSDIRFDPPHVHEPVLPAADVAQQLVRRRDASGRESISGFARAEFAAGQRSENVHLAFCPPFAASPAITVKQIDGPDARIKHAHCLPHGARLELRLKQAWNHSTTVLMRFDVEAAEEALGEHSSVPRSGATA